ncbi:MAG: YncE family protein [Inquilinus sp.]|uniref:YncE family protein n=1 Tax=Inquilinus sp. TaxID=1932117 RepID=UPI003F39D8C3
MGGNPVRALVVLAAAMMLAPAADAQSAYTLVKTIDLPGDTGGHGDWTTFDPATDTVWLSQSPDHNVVVIDAAAMTVKGVIPEIKEGNGIGLSPRYAFLADAEGNKVVVVDKATLQKVTALQPEGKEPDTVNYVAGANEIFVNTASNDMTVFSATAPFKEVGHFRLQPDPAKNGPDVALYVARTGRIYQPDDNVVDVIDPRSRKVVAVWRPGIQGSAKPMVFDGKTGHLLLGTTDKQMLVLDSRSGKVVTAIPVRGSVDETAIDEGARRAFVGDKDGVIEVIDLDTNKLVDQIASEKNVHTLTVDPKTHAVFVYRNESNKVDVFTPLKTAAK